jgi:hypothetical protein
VAGFQGDWHIFAKISISGMKLSLFSLLTLFWIWTTPPASAQFLNPDSSHQMVIFNLGYHACQPGGDLSSRFGFTNLIGGEMGMKLKNNWFFTAGGYFLFGGNVKEAGHMDNLKYNGRTILNVNGSPAEIRVWERGYTIPVRIGKIFPRLDPFKLNRNSGPFVEVGTQFIQHKIRIEDVGNQVPALSASFRPGYDRLTNGIGVMQSVGYRIFSTSKLINCFIAFDFMTNFTGERRDIQYDVPDWTPKKRTDLLVGIRAGWTIPIYKVTSSTVYYY